MEKVIITKNDLVPDMLVAMGQCEPGTEVVAIISDESDVAGKHVFGNIPLRFAALAKKVSIWNMNRIPKGLNIKSGEEFSKYVREIHTFMVKNIDDEQTANASS